jgi:hypothetical protein
MTHTSPKCHHTDLHIYAVISAILHSSKDQSGSVQYSLWDWDSIESIDYYECLSCGHK